MKKVVFALTALALTSGTVFAAESGDGTVKFTGEIVDSPCVLSVDSQNQKLCWVRYKNLYLLRLVTNPRQNLSKSNWKIAIPPR